MNLGNMLQVLFLLFSLQIFYNWDLQAECCRNNTRVYQMQNYFSSIFIPTQGRLAPNS